ncbi:MAG TPA: LacI family DNA-binding transcriptional regulator [Rhizomicrobium sp.]
MAGSSDTARKRRTRNVATIYDVAARAGVSKMTVSRVVNGEGYVRAETRDLVLKAVKDLQYLPNPAARSLASAEAARVGLLYNNPSATYFSEFLVGALEAASRNGIQLVLEKCETGDPAAARAAVRKLINGGLAGMVLPSPVCESSELIADLTRAGVSVVAIATGRFCGEASCVRIDEFKASGDMTRYLLGLGHRRIGFIKGHPDHSASAARLLGFETALREAGCKPDPALIVQGYFSHSSGQDAAEKLLSLRKMPTAIFACNDDMASAAVAVAHRKGLDVPGDLSVVGYDDTAMALAVWPQLTTIRQPISTIARQTLDLIAGDIRSRRSGEAIAPEDHVVAHSLIERKSAAAPRRA